MILENSVIQCDFLGMIHKYLNMPATLAKCWDEIP